MADQAQTTVADTDAAVLRMTEANKAAGAPADLASEVLAVQTAWSALRQSSAPNASFVKNLRDRAVQATSVLSDRASAPKPGALTAAANKVESFLTKKIGSTDIPVWAPVAGGTGVALLGALYLIFRRR